MAESRARPDWLAVLRHLSLTLAFCISIAAVQRLFSPARPFAVYLVYSLATGITIWAVVDFGRLPLTRGTEHGWPPGLRGPGLVLGAIVAGYFVGTLVGDAWFGWSSWQQSSQQIVSGWAVTLLAGGAATSYFYLSGRSAALQAQAETAKAQAAQAHLRLLQSQLDPHMLFNTLANLRSLINSDPARATAMLDRLNDYLRATLSASRTELHPLAAEFDRLRDYLELMAVRMGPRLSFSLELPPDLAALQIPTLLLQPLVENSIRHGLEPLVEGGSVGVSARRGGDGALLLEVADSGRGIADDSTAGAGFGLTHVRERLATVYGSGAALAFGHDDQAQHQTATVRIARQAVSAPQHARER